MTWRDVTRQDKTRQEETCGPAPFLIKTQQGPYDLTNGVVPTFRTPARSPRIVRQVSVPVISPCPFVCMDGTDSHVRLFLSSLLLSLSSTVKRLRERKQTEKQSRAGQGQISGEEKRSQVSSINQSIERNHSHSPPQPPPSLSHILFVFFSLISVLSSISTRKKKKEERGRARRRQGAVFFLISSLSLCWNCCSWTCKPILLTCRAPSISRCYTRIYCTIELILPTSIRDYRDGSGQNNVWINLPDSVYWLAGRIKNSQLMDCSRKSIEKSFNSSFGCSDD